MGDLHLGLEVAGGRSGRGGHDGHELKVGLHAYALRLSPYQSMTFLLPTSFPLSLSFSFSFSVSLSLSLPLSLSLSLSFSLFHSLRWFFHL
jgi:hypothetical protein